MTYHFDMPNIGLVRYGNIGGDIIIPYSLLKAFAPIYQTLHHVFFMYCTVHGIMYNILHNIMYNIMYKCIHLLVYM